MKKLITLALTMLFTVCAIAKTCEEEKLEQDFTQEVTHATGKDQCLIIGVYGSKIPKNLVILIHGDTVEPRVNAQYAFLAARNLARRAEFKDTLFVPIVRPGSPYDDKRRSTVGWLDSNLFSQHAYSENNVTEIAHVVLKLKANYAPTKVVLSGLSGGATISALMIDMFPDIAQGAVLSACPCDLLSWLSHRSNRLGRSLDPMKHVDKIKPSTKVIALTRDGDTNTLPQHAKTYIDLLVKKGVNAEFRPIKKLEDHNGTFFDIDVWVAVRELLTHDL